MDSIFRTRTLVYVVSALALTAVVWARAYWIVQGERQQRFIDSAEQARRLAVFFERNTLGIFRYGDAYLKMVYREFSEHGDVEAIRQLMRDVPPDRSVVSHITIIDESGTPILVSGHKIKPGVSAKDRDYFKYHQENNNGDIFVSLPHRGRNSGKLIVRLVRRFDKPDGHFGGVIFAAIEVRSIMEFYAAMNLGPNSSATLVGNDKKIRARSSYGRLGPGQDISGSRIWQELKRGSVGLYQQTSVVDGITRNYAYRQLSEFPLIVAIGVSTEDISLAVTRFQNTVYVIALLVTVLIVTMTILFSREILASQKLAASESHVRAVVESVLDGVITIDESGRIGSFNSGARNIFGYDPEEVVGRHISVLIYQPDGNRDNQTASDDSPTVKETVIDPGFREVSATRKDGTLFPAALSVGEMQHQRTRMFVVTIRDVTEAHALTKQIAHQATHDELTGLINRREFARRLSQALTSAQQEGRQHALCYLDLDHFKLVNDTAGHLAGDILLRQVSQLLANRIRSRDTLSRLGGDEFSVLLENCRLDKALEVAESLIAVVRDARLTWEDRTFEIGVSIGLVAITAEAESTTRLLSQADVACYTAKDLGRNRVSVYSPENHQMNRHHSEILLATELGDTLKESRFLLYAQPIFSLSSELDISEPVYYELLIRMLDRKGNVISPAEFIPAAERYGLMGNIDRWVIETALRCYWQIIGTAMNAGISINLSGNSLNEEVLLDFMRQQFKAHGVPPNRVCFEITETAAVSNLAQVSRFITAMKSIGCRFALDDFGNGLSSFTYLKHLPVDYLKIDGSFVKDMATDPINRAMTGAINELGHILGIRTVAEYAENETIVDQLASIGVDYAQGYALGSPVPLSLPPTSTGRRTLDVDSDNKVATAV